MNYSLQAFNRWWLFPPGDQKGLRVNNKGNRAAYLLCSKLEIKYNQVAVREIISIVLAFLADVE